jgi:hypothetical protein
MAACNHADVCGRDALDGHDGQCILHSENSEKDAEAFKEALEEHQAEHGPYFRWMVFPTNAYFTDATFEGRANFTDATFEGRANFRGATFEGEANFTGATFEGEADFTDATFEGEANFTGATFEGEAYFWMATFEGEAYFWRATFEDEAYFSGATFKQRVLFDGQSEASRLFAGSGVNFTGVIYGPDSPPRFRFADLSRCRFSGTDLQNLDFTGVLWCEEASKGEWFNRVGVYDEASKKSKEYPTTEGTPWSEIERLYRQLKKNYEDRGDFPRAGDFHMAEKEARRQNPETSRGVRFLLNIYRALSKYGERALPATFCLAGVVLGCALGYFLLGAAPGDPHEALSGVQALLFSFEATFFPFRPGNLEDEWARALNLFQRLVSPLLLALLALALRQRVKR